MKSTWSDRSKVAPILILRLAIGWHFLFEALVKLYNPGWSAKGYLMSSDGWFSFFFHWLGGNETLLALVDFLNTFGLLFVGLGLLLGLFYKGATIVGLALLSLYYLAHPPILSNNGMPTEGNYFLVDKVFIEAIAMWVLFKFRTNIKYGLDGLIWNKKVEKVNQIVKS